MSVVVVGLEHRRAPLELLEAVTVSEAELGKLTAELQGYGNLTELVVLSTCLRTEVYAVADRFHDAVAEITEVLAHKAGRRPEELAEALTIRFDYDVAGHLFAVASGLQSSVPGETEVLGQVRRAHEHALAEHTCGPVLAELFQAALHAGKRVRTETSIARGTTSFAHAAVELAATELGSFEGLRVAVVGAGDLGAGVLEALATGPATAAAELTLVNRSAQRAGEVVAALPEGQAARVGVRTFDHLAAVAATADLVITAVEADEPILRAEHLRDRQQALWMLDLGVPRNIDLAVRDLDGVTVLDVVDLAKIVDGTLADRREELVAASTIVNEEVHRYRDLARARGAAPVISALRAKVDAARATELARRRSEFADLDEQEWAKVEALTRSILSKVLHEPTVVVKEAAGTPRGERLVEALRSLFDL